MSLPTLFWILWSGCKSEASICQDLCIELVTTCEIDAYPSLESCIQGCEFSASEGADIEGQAECITAAECDNFAIIECDHEYGEPDTSPTTSGRLDPRAN